MGASHRQIVTEDHAVKLKLTPQNVLQPTTGKTGWLTVDLRIDHMGRHDSSQVLAQQGKGNQVVTADLFKTAFIYGNRYMGISFCPPVAGKMLAGCSHTRVIHTANKRPGQ